MKKNLLSLAVAALLLACNSQEDPYVVFKDAAYEVIKNEPIAVDLNSQYDLIVDNGYDRPGPSYFLSVNDGDLQAIEDPSVITREGSGWNGQDYLNTERVRIALDFSESNYGSGDELKVVVRHSQVERHVVFEVR